MRLRSIGGTDANVAFLGVAAHVEVDEEEEQRKDVRGVGDHDARRLSLATEQRRNRGMSAMMG